VTGAGSVDDAARSAARVRPRPRGETGILVGLLLLGACGESPTAPVLVDVALGRIIFVTSEAFSATFGGVEGGDRVCASLATAAGLAGFYRAWLSDDSGLSPSTTFTTGDTPVVLTSGVRVADDWEDLIDGTINNPVVVDERGDQPTSVAMVWTGTDSSGTATATTCNGWSSGSGASSGLVGVFDALDVGWTASRTAPCDQLGRMYCVQQ